jgi:hypothetical protein
MDLKGRVCKRDAGSDDLETVTKPEGCAGVHSPPQNSLYFNNINLLLPTE